MKRSASKIKKRKPRPLTARQAFAAAIRAVCGKDIAKQRRMRAGMEVYECGRLTISVNPAPGFLPPPQNDPTDSLILFRVSK